MNCSYPEIMQQFQNKYEEYVLDYKRYLKFRGFGDHVNDWVFVKRGFLECWLAPGFHRFWQTWNPGIGYFTYRLYNRIVGKRLVQRRKQNIAIVLTFLINGVIHNLLVMLIQWKSSFPLPFTFFVFGVFTVIFRELSPKMRVENWPKIIHLGINVGLVIVSFDFGFWMDDLLHKILIH
jgi:hypothetical protein